MPNPAPGKLGAKLRGRCYVHVISPGAGATLARPRRDYPRMSGRGEASHLATSLHGIRRYSAGEMAILYVRSQGGVDEASVVTRLRTSAVTRLWRTTVSPRTSP